MFRYCEREKKGKRRRLVFKQDDTAFYLKLKKGIRIWAKRGLRCSSFLGEITRSAFKFEQFWVFFYVRGQSGRRGLQIRNDSDRPVFKIFNGGELEEKQVRRVQKGTLTFFFQHISRHVFTATDTTLT